VTHPAQQYYNPDITAEQERALLRRNYLLLQISQAARGLISREILGIAVEPRPEAVVIHAAVSQETPALAEDLSDIVFELEALLGGGPEQRSLITTQIYVGQPDPTWPGFTHAVLYQAKPTEE
jgi:hypothetical protein